ncbi:MAG: hypothetical protein ACREQ5_40680, partial [Candidatus Dormibacteria bacterium]
SGGGMAGRHRRVMAPGSQRRSAPVTTTPPVLRTIEMTDGHTNLTHVTDEAMAQGRRAGGCYRAICGLRVLSASLAAPVQRHCPRCAMWRRR